MAALCLGVTGHWHGLLGWQYGMEPSLMLLLTDVQMSAVRNFFNLLNHLNICHTFLWLSLHGQLAVVCMYPILASTLSPPLPPPHTYTRAQSLTTPQCLWSSSRGMLSVSIAPSLKIRHHHACPLSSFLSKVCPIRAATFLSEPGDCDRLAKRHTYTDTSSWTHAEAQTEGRLVTPGRDQIAPDSSYKTFPGWGQCPA